MLPPVVSDAVRHRNGFRPRNEDARSTASRLNGSARSPRQFRRDWCASRASSRYEVDAEVEAINRCPATPSEASFALASPQEQVLSSVGPPAHHLPAQYGPASSFAPKPPISRRTRLDQRRDAWWNRRKIQAQRMEIENLEKELAKRDIADGLEHHLTRLRKRSFSSRKQSHTSQVVVEKIRDKFLDHGRRKEADIANSMLQGVNGYEKPPSSFFSQGGLWKRLIRAEPDTTWFSRAKNYGRDSLSALKLCREKHRRGLHPLPITLASRDVFR